MFSTWKDRKSYLLQLNAEIEARKGWAALREHYRRHPPPGTHHYNPNQPRVPAGNPDGGQWTSTGLSDGYRVYADASWRGELSHPGQVKSDATPDLLKAWRRYAEAASPGPDDVLIKKTEAILYDVLGRVNASVAASTRQFRPPEWVYGIMVHTQFGHEIRARNLPGIGQAGVEQTFNLTNIARYGAQGIRTDVVLRNHEGRIIAIFDVKTGNARMDAAREEDIRRHTGVGPDVPIIIMRAVRPY